MHFSPPDGWRKKMRQFSAFFCPSRNDTPGIDILNAVRKKIGVTRVMVEKGWKWFMQREGKFL